MRTANNRMRKQLGIALITTLLLLLLMSAMVVGFVLLVTEGQRLSGLNNDQSKAFYAAESGMEKLTADLGALFSATFAPTGAEVNALMNNPPSLTTSTGIIYQDLNGVNGYKIAFPPDNNGNPLASFAQITSGSSAFQGMTALETTYTLTVEARTQNNADVKLTRTTQTVGIPLFQFGIYCEGDCSFFPGPNFNFGGRVHSNGNLFFDSGGPVGAGPTQTNLNQLWMASPVTAHLDILRDCLPNTHPENAGSNHPGSVEITKGGGVFQALGFGQGSLQGCLNTPKNAAWPGISASFNGNLRSGVKKLNLAIVLLGNGNSQPIDIIRRPVQGENAVNPGVLGERYFSQASLRVLLSDNKADITGLPCVSAGDPFNLADLALPVANWATPNAVALRNAMNAAGTIPLPMAASGASVNAAAYVAGTGGGDGYWQFGPNTVTPKPATPIITGFIKIDAATNYGNPCGAYVDVTREILSLGYAGRNINPTPQSYGGNVLNPNWGGTAAQMQGLSTNVFPTPLTPPLPTLPIIDPNTNLNVAQMIYQNGNNQNGNTLLAGPFGTAQFNKGVCKDPHPNAVIRLERIRDNPSSVNYQSGAKSAGNQPVTSTVAEVCGVDPAPVNPALPILRTGPNAAPASGVVWVPQPSDFWPNVFFDTREGYNREPQPAPANPYASLVTLGGIMNYVELDVNNLARWFSGAIGASGPLTRDPNIAPNNFVVYISDRRGNFALGGAFAGTWPPRSPSGNETGEYGYGDMVNPANLNGCTNNLLDTGEDLAGTGILYTYGAVAFPPQLVDSTGVFTANTLFPNSLTATTADPNCPGPNGGLPWPRTFLARPNEGRENPPALFRRAVKLVNGARINTPLCPGNIPCGLTISTENPAYVQGDYNANSGNNGFNDPTIGASVVADAFTLLSDQWNDVNTFNSPFNVNGRQTGTAWYRLGVVAGKGLSFPIPAWDTNAIDGSQDFGTDGGVHNFMRYLERWTGTLNYSGSIVSLYYNRQGVGLYNSGTNNYSPPNRGYNFDANFLNPLLLPPRTPMFRDINTTGFTQMLLPNQ